MAQHWCWVQGHQVDAQLRPDDRGLAYGDGVFETVRLNPEPVLLDYHLERLFEGCRRLAIPLQREALLGPLQTVLEKHPVGVLKITVTRGAGSRGYSAPPELTPTLILSLSNLPDHPVRYARDGIAARIADWRLPFHPALAGIKHLNRLDQVMARREAPVSEYPELLLCDQQGNLIEGVVSNLFVVSGATIVTPDLDQVGVAGTLRRWLINDLRANGHHVEIGGLPANTLSRCSEVFMVNSVFGLWPVQRIDQMTWQPGPLVRHYQQSLVDWFGEVPVKDRLP